MLSQKSIKSRKIQIHITDSLNHRLSNAARESGVTKSAFVRVALEREFALEERLAVECANKPARRKIADRGNKNQLSLFKV
jgi:predicted DNA-binding protein